MNLFWQVYKHQTYKFQFSSKVSFSVYIYQPSGSLIDPTLLVGWQAMILISLAVMYMVNPPTAVSQRWPS